MDIGKLDQRITFQSPSEVNQNGEVQLTYATVDTVYGKVITQRGSEAFESARVNARAVIRVLVRYRSDVNTTWKMLWESQTYDIAAVDRSNRRQGELWITGQLVGAL
jgi:SPP1 family predicted phage head-tail adaptor